MHYTEVEMSESMSTPTKRFPQEIQFAGSDVLSGSSQKSRYILRYMRRIFSKAAFLKISIQKFIKPVVYIKISEDETSLSVLCRSGVTFVDKLMMDQLIRRAQSVDNKPSI